MVEVDLTHKFQATLVSSLIGDAVGSLFEFKDDYSDDQVSRKLTALSICPRKPNEELLAYTDDTCQMISLAECLLHNESINQTDLAQRFVDEHLKETKLGIDRAYGNNAKLLFAKIESQGASNATKLARKSFGGKGSYGNGAAMRVCPLALYYYDCKDLNLLLKECIASCEVTHTHPDAIAGALFQCLAIWSALDVPPNRGTEWRSSRNNLLDNLRGYIEKSIEKAPNELKISIQKFSDLFEVARSSLSGLEKSEVVDREFIIAKFGNHVSATKSVVSALVCSLLSFQKIRGCQMEGGHLQRGLELAYLLRGDTDTIGCMTGAIIGAYTGVIENILANHCEKYGYVTKLADKIYHHKAR